MPTNYKVKTGFVSEEEGKAFKAVSERGETAARIRWKGTHWLG
jgi:hypothetical protein